MNVHAAKNEIQAWCGRTIREDTQIDNGYPTCPICLSFFSEMEDKSLRQLAEEKLIDDINKLWYAQIEAVCATWDKTSFAHFQAKELKALVDKIRSDGGLYERKNR